jgi:hypothetical protein
MLVTVLAAPTAAAASHAVDGPKGADDWEIPNMRAALDDAWSADDAAPIHAASVGGADADELDVEAASADGARPRQTDAELCGLPNVAAAGCPALLTPGAGWWTGGAERRNAFLMSVLMRDNYPIVHNLGADNDDTPQKKALWQCLMRSKWLALGAEKVEFYESLLNTIVFIKVGDCCLGGRPGGQEGRDGRRGGGEGGASACAQAYACTWAWTRAWSWQSRRVPLPARILVAATAGSLLC